MAPSTPPPPAPVPSWMDLPPHGDVVAPPIDTLAAELPIAELRWEDFERLCLRLARMRSDVVGTRLYGTAGQDQQGIDLFGHTSGPRPYVVYQCKRVKNFEPALIVAAVDEFLDGTWADRSRELVLCTSDRLRTTRREETFEEQRIRLSHHDIALVPWTITEISDFLRHQPGIVHEFFGQFWVARYCGEVAALATASSIAPRDVSTLRTKLRDLYRVVFGVHDPGIAAAHDDQPFPLYERYVVHDVIEAVAEMYPAEMERSDALEDQPSQARSTSRPSPTTSRQRRNTLENELTAAPHALRVLLGGPGSGKSALLRYIALDLLSEAPRLAAVTAIWGRRLPIWIPFGAWVDRIERDRNASITQVVRDWLTQWAPGDLFPLVERALRDKRLLLLVDGLDEWTSEEAARLAVPRLRVFAEIHGVPVLLTSRPHGFRLMSSELPNWRLAELAPLSRDQQLEIAERWFEHRYHATVGSASIESVPIRRQSQNALSELHRMPAASALVEVPLLLMILLLLKTQNVELPSDRFRAYGELARHLMVVQPRRRAQSAERAERFIALSEQDLEAAYAYLAYRVHQDHPAGIIPVATARAHFEQVLHDDLFGMAFSANDAAQLARSLIDVGESVSGLLVKRSPRELGFYHRSIQEHLAARHLSSCPESAQIAAVSVGATNPLWRDVILALATRAPSQEMVTKIVRAIEATSLTSPLADQHRAELLTEIASGPAPCSVPIRTALIESACNEIEGGWCMPHRAALLETVLSGASRQSVKRVLLPRLRYWFPEKVSHRGRLLRAMGTWPEAEVWPHLRLSLLNDDHPHNQHAAADAIVTRWRGDLRKREELLHLASRPYPPGTRGVVVKALLDGWQHDDEIRHVLGAEGSGLSAEIAIVRILARIKEGAHSPDDRDELLQRIGANGADYSWRPIGRDGLLAGWPGDMVLRDACLQTVGARSALKPWMPRQDEAWHILLNGYPMDDAVAAALIEELEREYPRFAEIDWFVLGRQFRGHPALSARLESWIGTVERRDAEVAAAVVVARTPHGKKLLLANLRRNSQCSWAARGLLEGWGIGDPEVEAALMDVALGENRRSGWIAHFLPDVMREPERCKARLLDLLRDSAVDRTDFVVRGLERLSALAANDDFVRIALARIGSNRPRRDLDLLDALIRWNGSDPRVKYLAANELQIPNGLHSAVAEGCAGDAAVRQRVTEWAAPLPAELRRVIANSALRFEFRDSDMLDICRDFAWEREADIATASSLALHRTLRAQWTDSSVDIEGLRGELSCYGDRYETRRQAAYAAALEIGRYELIDEAFETNGDARPLRITLGHAGQPNRILIRQVLAHWSELESRYPGAVLSRLQDGGRNEATFDADLPSEAWAEVADEIERHSALDDRLQAWLSTKDGEVLEPSILLYLSRREPRSIRLRDHCVRVVMDQDRSWNFENRIEAAVEILAQQFAEDELLWARIEDVVGAAAEVPYGAFVALARARPHSAAVRARADGIWRTPTGRSAPMVFYALSTVGAIDDLFEHIDRYWGRGERLGMWLYRPLVERLARDAPTREAFEAFVVGRGRKAARIAVSVPLAVAAPLTTRVTAELEDLLASELSTTAAAGFTYDARSGLVRSMAAVLSEVMQSLRTIHGPD